VLQNLLLGLSMMSICLLLQGILVVAALRYYARQRQAMPSRFLASMRVTGALMLILIAGNTLQFTAWALLFYWLGEFATLNEAIYHSAVNFATLGYGDVVMSAEHRLLGPLEAINGALMIGVSTAALSRAFSVALQELVTTHPGPPPH
jgi:hypothetical protein|tara:strand:- start:8549 stop:8992 length:444 start_codon:yes stop_codon:yes gene_type:complete